MKYEFKNVATIEECDLILQRLETDAFVLDRKLQKAEYRFQMLSNRRPHIEKQLDGLRATIARLEQALPGADAQTSIDIELELLSLKEHEVRIAHKLDFFSPAGQMEWVIGISMLESRKSVNEAFKEKVRQRRREIKD